VPISAALRQDPDFKDAAGASRWQRVGDLIGLGFEPYTFRTRNRYHLCHLAGTTPTKISFDCLPVVFLGHHDG